MDYLQTLINKKEKLLLSFLFSVGLLLRLLGMINIRLGGDNVLHWKIAGEITHGIFPLLGPSASVNQSLNIGPAYYYLLSIPYFLGRGNFISAVIFVSLLSSLSIPLLYYVSRRWFSKLESFYITILYTFSAYFISIGNFPWNPYIMPLFIILSLLFINKINEGKHYFFPLLAASYSMCLQSHGTAIILAPIFLYMLPLKKISLNYYLLSLMILLLANFPWLYVNFTSGFSQITGILSILKEGKNASCSFSYWLSNHGHGEFCFSYFRNTLFVFRFISESLFNTTNILIVFLSMITTAIYFLRIRIKEERFILVWILVILVSFLFYSNYIYLHYFIILTPIPFFLGMIMLRRLKKFNKGEILINLIIFFLIMVNLIQFILSLRTIRG